MKYRSSTEIMDSILRSTKSGAKKTQIMYKAYLSSEQLKEYLRVLNEKELIKYEEDSRLYRVTDRGLRFMNVYDEISELISGAEERKPRFE
jgi:predicted transcriptional regulator